MEYNRPIVLSIAGYDPSGGAGVLADIKTIEQHACLGMAVLTATTIQTEEKCLDVEWQTIDQVQAPLSALFEIYPIQWVKIGMIENIETLLKVCRFLKGLNPNVHIVWDPVMASSSGFTFIDRLDVVALIELFAMLYLITPNVDEVKRLTKSVEEQNAARSIATHCPVLLTGGHRQTEKGEDQLFYKNKRILLAAGNSEFYDKHGTGCILSSAIVANLASGYHLKDACIHAKQYIEKIANGNRNKLAYHHDTRK